ncbi:MAG: lipopolysaccharide heptosyltransferase II [Ktedonobacterales bacterium]
MAKRSGQSLLRLLFGALGYCTRTSAERVQPGSGEPDAPGGEIRRILVIRVDLLGDVVLSLPAVRLLRRAYPEAQIDMLVQKSTAGILEGQPGISRVLAYDPHIWRRPATYLWPANWTVALRLLQMMRAAHYDLAVSISGDLGSILARLSGATRRFGYAREAYPFFLTDPLPGGRYLTHQHETRYVLTLAEAAGGIGAGPGDAAPQLSLTPVAEKQVAGMMDRARRVMDRHGPMVALHGGARNGQAKRWPTGHFARLAERLVEEYDALVVLTGAPGEVALAQAIQEKCRYPLLDVVGRTSLPLLTALLGAGDLVISGDSGPMHIACAVGTPVISLHGPTDPELSGPTSDGALVLRRNLWCSPCYDASATAECPFGNPVCMKDLTVDMVFRGARQMLGGYHLDRQKQLISASKRTHDHYAAAAPSDSYDSPDSPGSETPPNIPNPREAGSR